jgi:hypothetical protein
MKEVQIQRYRVCSLARKRLCVLCQTKMATTTQVASSARQLARAALHKARPSPTAALAKPVKKHEKLAKTLAWLTREPKPILGQIASLELTYAYKNDHFGARYVRKRLPVGQPLRHSDAPSSSTLPGYVSLLTFCYVQTFRKGGTPANRVQQPIHSHTRGSKTKEARRDLEAHNESRLEYVPGPRTQVSPLF